MTYKTIRYLIFTSLTIFILVNIVLIGLLTNWFRYSLSLESTVILIPLLITGGVGVILHYKCLKRNPKNKSVIWLPFSSFILTLSIFTIMSYSAFGELPSRISFDDIERSQPLTISTPKGELTYWIELWNTFSDSHAEYLLIEQGGIRKRIKVSIFGQSKVGGYSSSGDRAKWATLIPMQWENVYELKVHLSSDSKIIINIKDDGYIE